MAFLARRPSLCREMTTRMRSLPSLRPVPRPGFSSPYRPAFSSRSSVRGAVGAVDDVGTGLQLDGYGADSLLVDEVAVQAIAGHGGRGELQQSGKGRTVRNFKYSGGRNLKKKMFLPAGSPTKGGDGGSVVFMCDPGLKDLAHLLPPERRKEATQAIAAGSRREGKKNKSKEDVVVLKAKSGSNADHSLSLVETRRKHEMPPAKSLVVPVPPGTLVKRRKGGVVGELLRPRQKLVVAAGGQGGYGVKEPTYTKRRSGRRSRSDDGIEDLEDLDWKDEAMGIPGEQISLKLILRLVADVGLVGLPNAGKSSLLRALTRASPKVAPYPFTTLAPSLGVLSGYSEDEMKNIVTWNEEEDMDEAMELEMLARGDESEGGALHAAPVIADLPGLIEGAHTGKGLGRVFLRHLRRARIMCFVIDASKEDPIQDYTTLWQEMRMYNPDFVCRPSLVCLNKEDIFPEEERQDIVNNLKEELRDVAARMTSDGIPDEDIPRIDGAIEPHVIVSTSTVTGSGIEDVAAAIPSLLNGAAQ